eukprot:5127169-Amphidinium_carterae.1
MDWQCQISLRALSAMWASKQCWLVSIRKKCSESGAKDDRPEYKVRNPPNENNMGPSAQAPSGSRTLGD